MAQLTQLQIDELKRKGLTDDKIRALATSKGFELPKQSTLSKVGQALIKSEKGMGQSIAAGIAGNVGNKNLDLANQMNNEITTSLIKRIKEKRARGEDTSRLLGALKTMDKEVDFSSIINESTGNSLNKTGRQVFGEGLGIATDLLGAGTLPGAVKNTVAAKTFGQGFKQGAVTGIKGGATFGTAAGISRGMQEDKSAGEIVGQGLRSGIEGALAGGVLGGAIGGVAGGIAGRQERLLNKKLDYTLDLVSPKVTTKVAEKAGMEGRVTAPGVFTKSKITPSRRDILLADAVSDYVPAGAKPTEAVDAISRGVDEINSGLKGMIYERNMPIQPESLAQRFEAAKDDVRLIFASDKTAENTYNAVVKAFLKHIKSNDTIGLFEARQSFDQLPAIQKLLNSEGLGENTRREIVSVIRQIPNEFVADMLPNNNPLKAGLLQESRMIEAMSNIVQKNVATLGQSKVSQLLEKYPILKFILYGIGTGAVIGVTNKLTGQSD